LLSLLCGIKIKEDSYVDRREHLLEALPSWYECSCVDEIVLVDWGSDIPLSEFVQKNDKIKIIRFRPEQTRCWSFSQSYNTAARFASGDTFLIMNADEVILDKELVCNLKPPKEPEDWSQEREDVFYYEGTSWENNAGNGAYFVYISRYDFWSVNGYHEGIIGYGYDDVDLAIRLKKKGVRREIADVKIKHIKHEPTHRSWENMVNYNIAWAYPWTLECEQIRIEHKEVDGVIMCEIDHRDVVTEEDIRRRSGRGKALLQNQRQQIRDSKSDS